MHIHSILLRFLQHNHTSTRERILIAWYRQRLKEAIAPLIAKWEAIIGVQVAEWGVKQMKTRWGTCNIEAQRIWLNLELIKKPVHCLEYIIVHEMIHLLERHHNERFTCAGYFAYPFQIKRANHSSTSVFVSNLRSR